MTRRSWDTAAALSLLLFVAAAAAWACSYWFYIEAGLRLGRHLLAVGAAHGEASMVWDTDFHGDLHSYVRQTPLDASIYGDGMAHYLEHRFGGFAARYRVDPVTPGQRPTTFRVLVVPCWFVLLATAITPAYRLAVTRRARRRAAGGHCPDCGYDLRASAGRCPECGRPV